MASLVADMLGVCVMLADEAGDILRGVAEEGHLGQVRDKSDKKRDTSSSTADAPTPPVAPAAASEEKRESKVVKDKAVKASDPQTQADRRAERLIAAALSRRFGSAVTVLGEEALEGALVATGGVNADGTVDVDDIARLSERDVDAAARRLAVAAWEVTLPPGLEEVEEDSDVCVWVDPLVRSYTHSCRIDRARDLKKCKKNSSTSCLPRPPLRRFQLLNGK